MCDHFSLSISLSFRSPFLLLVDRPTYGSLVPLRSSYHCVGTPLPRRSRIEFFDRAGEEERRENPRKKRPRGGPRTRVRHPGRRKGRWEGGREGDTARRSFRKIDGILERLLFFSSPLSLSLRVFKFVEVRLGQLLPQILAIALPSPCPSPSPRRSLLPRVSSRWWRRLPVADAFLGYLVRSGLRRVAARQA